MSDDLLNSMLGDLLEGDEESGEKKPAADKGLEELLGGLMGGQSPQEGAGTGQGAEGEMGEMLGSLLGGGQQQGGDLGGMLNAILGGDQQSAGGADLGSMLGGLMGGGSQSGDISQMPIVGPILERLSQELGIPPNIAMALVSAVIGMLGSGQITGGRSMGLDDLANLAEDQSTVQNIAQEVAGETGIDENTVVQAVQHILKMLFQGEM